MAGDGWAGGKVRGFEGGRASEKSGCRPALVSRWVGVRGLRCHFGRFEQIVCSAADLGLECFSRGLARHLCLGVGGSKWFCDVPAHVCCSMWCSGGLGLVCCGGGLVQMYCCGGELGWCGGLQVHKCCCSADLGWSACTLGWRRSGRKVSESSCVGSVGSALGWERGRGSAPLG